MVGWTDIDGRMIEDLVGKVLNCLHMGLDGGVMTSLVGMWGDFIDM